VMPAKRAESNAQINQFIFEASYQRAPFGSTLR
jgi:hypothetical protein